jgi:SAM-dependent methyltransferase
MPENDYYLYLTLTTILFSAIGLSWFAGSDAPYVPTKIKKTEELLKKAGLKNGHHFYELGSGDGRMVYAAAKIGANATGIEQSWLRVWFSRYKAKKMNLKNIEFIHGNIFDRQYFPADCIFIFLLQPAVDKLEKKLRKELKKGCIVITQTFHFKHWKPIKKIDLTENNKNPLGKDLYAGDFWVYKV